MIRTPRTISAFSLCLVLFTASRTSWAQEDDPKPRNNSFEVGVFGGAFLANPNHEFYNPNVSEQEPLRRGNPMLGLRAGFYPLGFIGAEGEADAALSETDSGDSASLYSLRASVVLQVPLRVTPFLLGGIGNTWLRSDSMALGKDRDRVWHAGLGVKIFATPTLQIRVDGRLYRTNRVRADADPTDDNGLLNHYSILAGVAWTIGGSAAIEEPDENPDPDDDGFVAPEDKCPDEKGVEPDGCPAKDSDGDGLDDASDKCPAQAETVNGVDDTDGCPDDVPDPDGDGVRGDADKCPDQPEDVDSFQDEDGCPDLDNDQDGLVDASDACPTQSGPAENRGCPDTDKDGDTVVDRLDNCPDEAGKPEFQGCKTKQLVVITQTQLKILDKVYFATGKARILPRSRRLLNNVAQVIGSHPEIKKVRVEGHTDDRGSDEFNRTLSQKRADAVVEYLVGKGVASERLAAAGFGEDQPLASNASASGRASNRRVEFNIEDAGAPGAPSAPGTPSTPGTSTDKDKDKDKPAGGGP